MKRALVGFGVACFVGAAVGCNPFAPDQSVVLAVEKIDAPATSPVASPLTVVLTVTIGMCESFDRLEARSDASGAFRLSSPLGDAAAAGLREKICLSWSTTDMICLPGETQALMLRNWGCCDSACRLISCQ